MDENFLLQPRPRHGTARLHEEGTTRAGRSTSSPRPTPSADTPWSELVELGISWVWMGLESPNSTYSKLNGTDTVELAGELRSHGIKLLGSTIVGLEHHTPENIRPEIEHAVSHNTDFHQFMLYTPVPGTPLYQEMTEQGRMLPDVDLADIHGQYKFNFEHAAISRDESKRFLDWAFRRDFERNGPSLYRICRTTLEGWKRYKDHPEPRVRQRFEWEVAAIEERLRRRAVGHGAAASRRPTRNVSEQIHSLRREIGKRVRWLVPRVVAALVGPVLLWTARREEKRLADG